MTPRFLPVALIVLAAATLAAQTRSGPGGNAAIVGVVVTSDTAAPVRGATVVLTTRSLRLETTTDAAGRFEFRELPSNTYTLGVTKAGFVSETVALAERGVETLVQGTAVRLEIPMIRGSAIAGRVIDRYGDPVAAVTVSALRLHYQQPGQPTVQVTNVTKTNDLGEYRLFGLESASYFVATGVSEVMSQFYGSSASARRPTQLPAFSAPRIPAPTYFPGTIDAASAQPITLRPGDQILGTDLRTTNAGTVHLGGRVIDSYGAPVDDTYVILNPAPSSGALPNASRVTTTDAAGAFAFPGLPPGEYVMHAVALATPLGVAAREKGEPAKERGVPEFASDRLSVVGDQAGFQLQTRPGVDVKGRVTIDGGSVNPAGVGNLRVVATPAWPAGEMIDSLLTSETAANPDGAFTLRNTSGHRRFLVTGFPAGSFLSRVVVGGVDVTDIGVDMSQAATGVTVELTTKPARLEVTIKPPAGQPASGSFVVFAEDSQLWTRFASRHVLLRTATGDAIRIDTLPAGRYLVAAIHGTDRKKWADPAFLEYLRPLATPVTLVAGETRSVTVQWR